MTSCRSRAFAGVEPDARQFRDAMVLPVWEGPEQIQALELLRAGKPARLTEPKDDEEARVEPVAREEFSAGGAAGLCDLAFMVRKDVVLAARMDVKGLA